MHNYNKYLDKFPSLEGKNIIVTGANSGLGFETCRHLIYKKANVIMACRNLKKANEAKEKLLKENNLAKIKIYQYDQSSFESIREFKNNIVNDNIKIDALICNAGVYYPKKKYLTKDGFELTFGTNYLGTYYLLKCLNGYLEQCDSRIIIVTSLTGMLSKHYQLNDINNLNRNDVYSYSKYCLSRLCYELDLNSINCKYYLIHPGICQTNIISSEQTGLPNWFSKIGHAFLYVFVHSATKASLCDIKALTTNEKQKKYIKPRGLFAISGYPTLKKYPKYAKKSIIEETEKLINEVK